MTATLPYLAIILAFALGAIVIWLCDRTRKAKPKHDLDNLKRELQRAEQLHRPRAHIRKLFVQATADRIRKECGL